jgi:NADH-quinone oxidoreductase subunit I
MTIKSYFRNIFDNVSSIAIGMKITLKYCFQKTVTVQYPEQRLSFAPRYRGIHEFEADKCIACDMCAKACPVDCIYIDKMKNPVGKGFRVTGFKIDYTKCMFCALCVDPCPVDCIFMGSTYDQSCFSRDGCIVDFARLPLETAWGQASLNPIGVAASKLQTEPVWVKPPDPPPPAKPAAPAATPTPPA